MCVCFIDNAKAFDRVKHDNVIYCLKEIGLDEKDIRVIPNLYWHQKATIRADSDIPYYTTVTTVKRGVRQG